MSSPHSQQVAILLAAPQGPCFDTTDARHLAWLRDQSGGL
jgi:hypothetical protein